VINVRITPQADLSASSRHVAECTQPDSCTAAKPSLDRLVSAGKQRRRHFEAERLRCREIDDEFELGRLAVLTMIALAAILAPLEIPETA
jgi:hypothetical protein